MKKLLVNVSVLLLVVVTLSVFCVSGYVSATGKYIWLPNDDELQFGGATSHTTLSYSAGYVSSTTLLTISDADDNALVTLNDEGAYATLTVPGGYISAATHSCLSFACDGVNIYDGTYPTDEYDQAWVGWMSDEVFIAGSTSFPSGGWANIRLVGPVYVGLTGADDIYADDYIAGSTACALANATATTLQIGGAASTISIGAAGGTATFATHIVTGLDLQINGGDLLTDDATFNLINAVPTTINFGGAATALNMGNASGTVTMAGDGVVTKDWAVNGGDITSSSATATLFNTTPTTVNIGGNATAMSIGKTGGTVTFPGDIHITGNDLTFAGGTAAIADNTATTTVNFARNAAVIAGATSTAFTIQGDTVCGDDLYITGNDIFTPSGALYLYPNNNNTYINGDCMVTGRVRYYYIGTFAVDDTTPAVAYNVCRCCGKDAMTVTSLDGVTYPTEITVLGSFLNDLQTVTVTDGNDTDSFTLTFSGQTTASLDWDCTAAEMDTALEALSNIGENDVTVSEAGGVYTVMFVDDMRETNQAEMTNTPTGCTVVNDTTSEGGAANTSIFDDDAGNMLLNGDWTCDGGDTIKLIYDPYAPNNGKWIELSRSST